MSTMADLRHYLQKALMCGEVDLEVFHKTTTGIHQASIKEITISEQSGYVKLLLDYEDSDIVETISITPDQNGLAWHRHISNASDKVIPLVECGLRFCGISFGCAPEQDYFYHTENPRIYNQLAIPVDLKRSEDMVDDSGFDAVAGNKWADPGVVSERIGDSPYQPFPAILISNFNSRYGFVHGTLSQDIFYHYYLVEHGDKGVQIDMLSSFKAISHLELKGGACLDDYFYTGWTDEADTFDALFKHYKHVLKRYLPALAGAGDHNRYSLVWGSWNDGIFRDIDEGRLVEMADFIQENLPTVEWMQIDDGYAANAGKLNIAHGLGAPYEDDYGIDREKFPHGYDSYTDAIRARGIKPALWIGGAVPKETPLYQEHPEWFIDYSYRITKSAILDVSKPEVRQVMTDALAFYFNESGFEGMKHDFWSYAFEDSHSFLENKEQSGYQWRRWWLSEVRRHLPNYGYLQTGCDIVMANPFLAEFFTNYRYGIDIGAGNWDYIVTNFLWGAACFALHVGDIFVPNSDSIGLFPGLTDEEALLCINYCLISRSMVEVAGWLYQEPDHPRMKWVKKALCCPNNGQHVYFSNYDYRTANGIAPEIWYLKTAHFSLLDTSPSLPQRTVAVFNLEEDERSFNISPKSVGLAEAKWIVTDVWSQESVIIHGEYVVHLKPHCSCLLAFSLLGDAPVIMDANMKIDDVKYQDSQLCVSFAYQGHLELLVSGRPRAVNGGGGDSQIEQLQHGYLVSCVITDVAVPVVLDF